MPAGRSSEAARPAEAADAERVGELRAAAHEEWATLRGGQLFLSRELPVERGTGRDAGAHSAWVGSFDGYVVGYGMAHIEDLGGGALHGVIDELFVDPPARSVGVGETITRAMTAWFARAGCSGIDAYALPGHRTAKTFFESGGFKARLIVLHRQLDA